MGQWENDVDEGQRCAGMRARERFGVWKDWRKKHTDTIKIEHKS